MPSSDGLVDYVYILGGSCPITEFCQLQNSLCVQVLRFPLSYIGTVTARHSRSGRQTNFAALSRGRHLYSAGRPSRWAETRHRASTSMYSLTFCVRVMSPERHHWKSAVQAAAVMLRTAPLTASHRPASHAHLRYTGRNVENASVTRRSLISNARTLRVN